MGQMLAFSLDTTFGRIAADLLLILVIAFNMWIGWRRGLVRRALIFAGLYAAVLAATYLGNSIASVLGGGDRLSTNSWTFVTIFLGTIFLFEIIVALYQDQLQNLIVITFDRVAGLIAGLLVGVFEVGIIFLVAIAAGNAPAPSFGNNISADYHSASDAVTNATLSEYVVDMEPGIKAIFGPVLPGDLTDHLTEGTKRSTT